MLYLCERIVHELVAGRRVALCTLIDTRGSTPQEPGAKLILLENGSMIGTLGGGCVEAEVQSRAMELLPSNRSEVLRFRLDHDYGWDDGLLCGGTATVLVTVLEGPAALQKYGEICDAIRRRQHTELRLTYPDHKGQTEQQEERVYIEPIPPTPVLLIAGGGHIGMALARIAHDLGFQVAVIDDRPEFVTEERFPTAHVRIAGRFEVELARFPIDPHTYVVVVTRGHKRDGRALATVIHSPARYLGLIGSKRKVLTIYRELLQKGVAANILQRVHAPIGLEIHAVTVNEIALSIAAELVAVRRGRQNVPAEPMRVTPAMVDRLGTGNQPPDGP